MGTSYITDDPSGLIITFFICYRKNFVTVKGQFVTVKQQFVTVKLKFVTVTLITVKKFLTVAMVTNCFRNRGMIRPNPYLISL